MEDASKKPSVRLETVRFYERCGILVQPPSRGNGWQEYDYEVLALIRYIKQAQQMGFSLSELKDMQSAADGSRPAFCESVRNATREKSRAVERQIEDMQTMQRDLETFLARCTAKEINERCPIYETCVRLKGTSGKKGLERPTIMKDS
jgi:MerR family mercuric resistance operon transcriptional regulator